MATISLLADLSTFPITRQELADMWNTATVTNIEEADLSDELIVTDAVSNFSDFPTTPEPGKTVYHMVDNVLYTWHDVVNGTGVSLWLAWGPDKFEIPCVAFEPIPAGAPVDIVYDRWVALPTEPHQVPLGYNQSGINDTQDMNAGPAFGGETTPSGSWLAVGVDGILVGRLESALSHASGTAFTNWDVCEFLAMDPLNPQSLINAGSKQFPLFNVIGTSLLKSPSFAGTAASPSEPTYFTKFSFSPRVYRPFGAGSG